MIRIPTKVKYLLPNAATALNLFLGFWSVTESMRGNYREATIYILIGILIDTCDGTIARLLNATSLFGREFDSLADLTTFGIAPSVLLYQHFNGTFGGMCLSFLPTLCAALRLARFNTQPPMSYFTGLPTPAAAALIVGFLAVGEVSSIDIGIVILLTCVLMVGNICFPRGIGWLRQFKRGLPAASPQLSHDPQRGQ